MGTGYQDLEFRGKKAYNSLTFWAPHSWFAYCPICGEVWARGLSTYPKAQHMALKMNCERHQGGSLIKHEGVFNPAILPHTKEFLLYELDLYLKDPELYKYRDLISQSGIEFDKLDSMI